MTLEVTEIVFLVFGLTISMVAFFLKKESHKVDSISKKLRQIEVELARNSAKDSERWRETQKLLEDRRTDVISLYKKFEK